jgi:hypothetical protein
VFALAICLASTQSRAADPQPLPKWLQEAIAANAKKKTPDTYEESLYLGNRAFHMIRGDRADTGDEHLLFAEDGRQICQFGGFVGRVTAGSCELDKIIYVWKIFPVP